MRSKDAFDIAQFRNRVADAPGKSYWRSLDELAQTGEFQTLLEREFPENISEWTDAPSRRRFLQLMAASLALAGLNGCTRQPEEKIVPYVEQPEILVPGKPLYFATSLNMAGDVVGVLVESHMGRPTKIEGNSKHPAVPPSHWGGDPQVRPGATDAITQASILSLYDPDRSQAITRLGEISSWGAFVNELDARLQLQRGKQGAGLRVLTETVYSPTLAAQLNSLVETYPQAKWIQWEPVNRDNARAGAIAAFGEDVTPVYHFNRADVILSLDDDFLASGPGRLNNARNFIERRRVRHSDGKAAEMNRLYMVQSTPTITGAAADHQLSLRPSQIEALAREIARRLEIELPSAGAAALDSIPAEWIDAVVDDLQNYRLMRNSGACLVLAGQSQPPIVHAIAHVINHQLGAVGTSVTYIEPAESNPASHAESLAELVDDMRAGQVEMLLIVGGNPVYAAPADLAFAEALKEVAFSAHTSLYQDETSVVTDWHIAETHPLESWSDLRAYDGTASLVQPLIAPLYSGRSPHELLSAMLGQSALSAYDIVRDYWKKQTSEGDFEKLWQVWLHEGMIEGTAYAARDVSVDRLALSESASARGANGDDGDSGELQIAFQPDPSVYDGRFANNGWLQELPKPLTKLTWDNAALVSPQTASQLRVQNEDLVEIKLGDRTLSMPVWIVPGQPDGSLTVHLGYGRTQAGRVGNNAGFNAYAIRTTDSLWNARNVSVRKLGGRYPLATTQHHALIGGRELIRSGTLEEFREHPNDPHFMHAHHEAPEISAFHDEWKYDGYKWGMTIDVAGCIGCNACVVACQAENNIPIVGKDQVLVGREMHWLRVDRYYSGEEANPETYFEPLPCMHCEMAPCELVCPVAATVHSDEGLNEMVYNRCVGTRYCSNNCPYKVRRFNYLQYTDLDTPVLKLLNNPDVTVRTRGVMEKCTYCVQRISSARIEAEKEDRNIRDGEMVTACQAVCPTQAIVFGDLNDPNSQVSKLHDSPLNYSLLAELNTRPRTTYLADLRNPNPKLVAHS